MDTKYIFQREEIGKVRTAQEDSHDIAVFTPNGDVFVVCDGMGGHVGGKTASSIAVRSIIEYLKKEKYPDPLQALDEALQFANMQILGYADEHPELKGMGTTACIVLLQDSKACIAHVGDSRIYLYLGKEKQLHRITKDHSYVQALVDAGEISDEEAEHHPNKNRILKALGIKGDLNPSIDVVQPKKGDVFLICSDGLSGMVVDTEMERILAQEGELAQKGDELIDTALENGGLDNVTLELIQITTSPYPRSTFKSYNPPNRIQVPGPKMRKKRWMVLGFVLLLFCIAWMSKKLIVNALMKYETAEIAEISGKMRERQDSIKKKIDAIDIKAILEKREINLLSKVDSLSDLKLLEKIEGLCKKDSPDIQSIKEHIISYALKNNVNDLGDLFDDANAEVWKIINELSDMYKSLGESKKKHESQLKKYEEYVSKEEAK